MSLKYDPIVPVKSVPIALPAVVALKKKLLSLVFRFLDEMILLEAVMELLHPPSLIRVKVAKNADFLSHTLQPKGFHCFMVHLVC